MNDIFAILGKIVTSVGGAGIIIIGMSGFISKLWLQRYTEEQRKANKIELEKLKGQISKEIEAVKSFNESALNKDNVLFHNEIEILKESYPILMKMYGIVEMINMDIYDGERFKDASDIEIIKLLHKNIENRINAFKKLNQQLQDSLFYNIGVGFIDKDIYDNMEELQKNCMTFVFDAHLFNQGIEEDYAKLKKRYVEIEKDKTTLYESIRRYFKIAKQI